MQQAEIQHQCGTGKVPWIPPHHMNLFPQTPYWDGSHPIPTPAAGQEWAVVGHSLRSRTNTQECHPWVPPGGFQPWKQPSRLWDVEHPLALTQGGMVWRTHPDLLQDFRRPVLGSSNPTSIQDGPEGNWFQFAAHPRATGPFPAELGRWDIPQNHPDTPNPTFCSATMGQ